MKINKKILSILLITLTLIQMPVFADTIEVSTALTELDDEQILITGTNEQLKNINKDTVKFIKEIAFEAVESGRDYGLFPSVTIAQAILESRSGNSGLSKEPYNNLFGVKGFYKGNSVSMKTKEDDGKGNLYEIYANFKKYPNKEASLRDHDELLRYGLKGFYSCAWRENAETPRQATECLQGRYATDTSYSTKLMNIIDEYNLERFDNPLTPRDLKWLNSDSLDPWELPVINNETMEKIQTWASGANDSVRFAKLLKDIMNRIENNDEIKIDEFYVQMFVDVDLENAERYKDNPQIGDVAVYLVENSEGEIIEHYAIIQGLRENIILISEGVMSENGFREIYRTVPRDSLEKFEFISVEKDLEVYEEK